MKNLRLRHGLNPMAVWCGIMMVVMANPKTTAAAFGVTTTITTTKPHPRRVTYAGTWLPLKANKGDEETSVDELQEKATKRSLEGKMKAWEATEEEQQAATLGGLTPSQQQDVNRSDAFDVGLWILFPFMVLGSLAFALFPFIMDKIDVSSVGPPPTV